MSRQIGLLKVVMEQGQGDKFEVFRFIAGMGIR